MPHTLMTMDDGALDGGYVMLTEELIRPHEKEIQQGRDKEDKKQLQKEKELPSFPITTNTKRCDPPLFTGAIFCYCFDSVWQYL